MRVGRWDTRSSREVLYLRKSIEDAFKWSGCMVMVRQKEFGESQRCPKCWDEDLKQVTNTRCSECGGTGFVCGGYRPPIVTWASVSENSAEDEKTEKAGTRTQQNVKVKLLSTPVFRDGDVMAEVVRSVDGRPKKLGRVFYLEGPVDRQTVQGWVSNNTNDRDMRLEDMIVSQSCTAKLALPTDHVYSESFWGLETSPNLPDSAYEKPMDRKRECAREVDGRHVK